MRISAVCNGALTIQANTNKEGDFELVNQAAELMADSSEGEFVITSSCEYEQWVQLCAKWDNYQAKELKDAYYSAKKLIESKVEQIETHSNDSNNSFQPGY